MRKDKNINSPLIRALTGGVTPGTPLASVLPDLDNLDNVDEYIRTDPCNLVAVLPEICSKLNNAIINDPQQCELVWDGLLGILKQLSNKANENRLKPPLSQIVPYTFVNCHGEEWHDDYAWLNDKTNPKVLEYINLENEYTEKYMDTTKGLQKLLFKEFVERLHEDDESARVLLSDGWVYYSKYRPGEEYRIHCREKDGVEEIYIDENELSKSPEANSYFRIGFLVHSPDSKYVAIGLDYWGNERYTASFLNMDTKEFRKDKIQGVYEDFVFGNDSDHVYYTLLDDCERAYQVKRHVFGEDVESDQVLHHETDEMFFVTIKKSCDEKYMFMKLSAQITSETWYLSANDAHDTPHLLFPRRENVQYNCEHHDDYFYILTNDGAKNNYIARISLSGLLSHDGDLNNLLETVIEHRDFVFIEDFQVRKNHLIVFERSNCLQNIRIINLRKEGFTDYHYVGFSEVVYSIWPGTVRDGENRLINAVQYDSNVFRFTYSSFVQPKEVIDYDMDAKVMTVVQEEMVGGSIPYDKSKYSSKRLYATGVDGTAIPLSIVYRKDLLGLNMPEPQYNPVLLHAYGAYGSFTNPIFSSTRLSLLDRGFIYCTAHVRGGADMGCGWYEEGKLAKKPNTFHDFCSVAEYLIKEGYTTAENLSIYGRSAGGLLIGAVVNFRPDLFKAALTEVPFVDVINTMFDTSIPWTAFEFEEWGDPRNREIYDVMKTYCPYTNISGESLAKNKYPHMLVIGGMNDPRVAFFEPLKFVAKMRGERNKWSEILKKNGVSINGPERVTLLRIQDVGHGGPSGQYSHLEDLAFEYAFLITSLQAPMQPLLPNVSEVSFESVHHNYEKGLEALSLDDMRFSDIPLRKTTKRRGKDDEDKEYRTKAKKGDRGRNRLFQWLNNFGL